LDIPTLIACLLSNARVAAVTRSRRLWTSLNLLAVWRDYR
jgi:hypothetical protein